MTLSIVRKENSRDHMHVYQKGELVYLSAPLLEQEEWLVHGFTTRLGGVSEGDVGTMNMSYAREENHEHVTENHRRICAALGVDWQKMVFSYQTHTTNVRKVSAEDAGLGIVRERTYTDIDALMTDVPGITLAVFMADCVPLLLADPVHHAIGAAHSGWRGTVGNIAGNLIVQMHEAYGTNPEDLVCVIGQSICGDCYEVSEDVVEQFKAVYPEELWSTLFVQKDNGKFDLNLWSACIQNFLSSGVKRENIAVSDICTKCNPNLLFSHRAHHGRQGNMAALISIRE